MRSSLATKIVRRVRRVAESPAQAMKRGTSNLLFHSKKILSCQAATVVHPTHVTDDTALVKRIIAAYQRTHKVELGTSMWKQFFASHHSAIHDALMKGNVEKVAAIFRSPVTSDLFYGFDILTKSLNHFFDQKKLKAIYANACLDGLMRFAEATGTIKLVNPEAAQITHVWKTEEVLEKLSANHLIFSMPSPFTHEHGLKTSRGIMPYRATHALYQAWRIKELTQDAKAPSVVEIGAGLGRTAYYAYEMGIKDYTIVDIPISAAAQAYFLGRTLGEHNLLLDGEEDKDAQHKIKILPPHSFFEKNATYDLIANVDSLPEMDIAMARAYWDKIKSSTKTFLSINHEANPFSVLELVKADKKNTRVYRTPYWMRQGYIEELVTVNE